MGAKKEPKSIIVGFLEEVASKRSPSYSLFYWAVYYKSYNWGCLGGSVCSASDS